MTTYVLSLVAEGRDNASGPLGRVSGALSAMGNVAGGILGAGALIAIGRQILDFGTNALAATAQVQAFEMGLTTLVAKELKSADATLGMNKALDMAAPLAGKLADQLRDIAIISPYELGTVQDTFRLAMAFGFSSAEATSFTKSILNMAAGVGANNEMLGRMSYNLAQIRLQGKVTAMDIRQLAMAGFDLNAVLKSVGDQFGVTIKDHNDFNKAIEEGKLTWEQFTLGFEKYANENFGGASERMSRTLMGLKSTFKDFFLLTMPKLLGPAAEKVTDFLNKILNKFIEFSDSGKLEEWGNAFGEVVGNVLENGEKLFSLFGFLYDSIEQLGAADTFLGENSPFALAMRGLFQIEVGQITGPMKTVFDTIKTVFTKGLGGLDWDLIRKTFVTKISNALTGLDEAFDKIDWASVSDKIIEFINGIDWNQAGVSISSGISQVIELMKSNEGLYARLRQIFKDLILNALTQINWPEIGLLLATGFTDMVLGMFGSSIEQVRAKGAEMGILISNSIKEGMFTSSGSLTQTGRTIINLALQAISGMVPLFVGQGILAVANLASGIFSSIGTMRAAIIPMAPAAFEELKAVVKAFYTQARMALQGFAKSINENLNVAIKAITDAIEKILSVIKPIVIPVSFGNPGSPPSFGGASGGTSNNNKGGSGGSSSNSGANYNPYSGFSKGGISKGAKSGHMELLHGEEAVIPLQGGAVPVRLGGKSSTRGDTYVNITVEGSGDPEAVAAKLFRMLKSQGLVMA